MSHWVGGLQVDLCDVSIFLHFCIFFSNKHVFSKGTANTQHVWIELFNWGFIDLKLFIADSLLLACIPKCILCSKALQCLASSVKWDEKVLRNDNAPTYLSTQINKYKQMAWIPRFTPTGVHTHTCKCTAHMHVDLSEAELKHQNGGVFRTSCYTLNPKSVFLIVLCLLIAHPTAANSLSPM